MGFFDLFKKKKEETPINSVADSEVVDSAPVVDSDEPTIEEEREHRLDEDQQKFDCQPFRHKT